MCKTQRNILSLYNNQFILTHSYKTRFSDACICDEYICVMCMLTSVNVFVSAKVNSSNGETYKSCLLDEWTVQQTPKKKPSV